jgi:anti-sigma regulatory factor (Ser/Thr protein kinase)
LTASHLAVDVRDPSQVGEARRAAVKLSQELGFDEEAGGRVALVATELGTNLVRHAQGGRLLLAARGGPPGVGSVEMLSLDEGPGMADLAACRRDGYSTAGTPGTGLGAIERMSDEFSIASTPGRGTIAVARVFAQRLKEQSTGFRIGGLSACAPGETVCGDSFAVSTGGQQASVIVADGLGHGPGAAEASQAAVKVFDSAAAGSSPAQVLERSHAALRITRGAAVAVAQLDAARGTLVFAGAGNIAGRIVSGVSDRSLLSQHGTVGLQMRRVQELHYEWPAHALLILHSDGIATRWTLNDTLGLLQSDPLVIAAWLLREHSRGRDDATAVVIRRTAA